MAHPDPIKLGLGQFSMQMPGQFSAQTNNKIDHSIEDHNLSAIYEVLRHSKPNVKFESQIEVTEGFAAVACAFLSVPPKDLQELFMEAFAEVRSFNPAT